MENRAHALIAGIFLLLMGLALAGAAVWFQGDTVERVSYTVVSRSGVPGLNIKASVKLRGVAVGKVEAIGFDPADPQQILVTISIDKAAPVTTDTYAQLGLQEFTGLSFIALESDAGASGPRAEEGARIALRPTLLDRLAETGPGLMLAFGETAQALKALLADAKNEKVLPNLAKLGRTADEATRLLAALQPTAKALPGLVQEVEAGVQRSGVTLQQAEVLIAESRGLVQELRSRAAVLDKLGPMAQQLQDTVRHLEAALVGSAGPPDRPLIEEVGAASRAIERAANDLAESPQSLVFGRGASPPGPGETGFGDRLKGAR